MPTLTIPKEIIEKKDELVLVPRKEYEEFSRWRATAEPLRAHLLRRFPEVAPTHAELRALKRGREAMKRGDYITYDQLIYALDTPRGQARRKKARAA